MIKYAKIIDINSGLCDVGIGSNDTYYRSIGMEQLDVTEGFDGRWYLAEKTNTDTYIQNLVEYNMHEFSKQFFETSKGWVRRKVRMSDGSVKDFLSDILLQIKAGLDLGENVNILTYRTPDYTHVLSDDYFVSLQEVKQADLDFVRECLARTMQDWQG